MSNGTFSAEPTSIVCQNTSYAGVLHRGRFTRLLEAAHHLEYAVRINREDAAARSMGNVSDYNREAAARSTFIAEACSKKARAVRAEIRRLEDRREADSKRRFDPIFRACPGAWYGNAPIGDGVGNILVDATKIAPAILFLSRRALIVGTSISHQEGAIHVSIRWKPARAPKAKTEEQIERACARLENKIEHALVAAQSTYGRKRDVIVARVDRMQRQLDDLHAGR